jgi:hypothetical protein
MRQIGCTETSVSNYHSTLRYTPEERSSHLHHGGSLKSLTVSSKAVVKKLSESKEVRCSVKPDIKFHAFLILRIALDGKKRGLTWRLQESLEDMEYADDVCLVSHKY